MAHPATGSGRHGGAKPGVRPSAKRGKGIAGADGTARHSDVGREDIAHHPVEALLPVRAAGIAVDGIRGAAGKPGCKIARNIDPIPKVSQRVDLVVKEWN